MAVAIAQRASARHAIARLKTASPATVELAVKMVHVAPRNQPLSLSS